MTYPQKINSFVKTRDHNGMISQKMLK